jgi:O-antigen/teichoic acid export membrane protein
MEQQLKQKATNAFLWDTLGLFSKHGIAFIVSIFLARLLTPEEFGLVSIALVFISLSQVFADFGFGSALIQEKHNSSLTYSSIFFINIVAGVFLFALFWLIAPWIADFYNNSAITSLIRLLSLSFVFSSFNLVQQTIVIRDIEFKKITIRRMLAYGFSGLIAIYCAFIGWGVYALVVQNLSAALINTVILWKVAEWQPKFEFSWKEVRRLTGFSVYVFFSQLSNKLITQLDTLIVGKLFSPAVLGFYNRAASLNSLVTTFSTGSIATVSFPVMSKIRDDRSRFENAYFQLLELISFGSFLLSGCLILGGKDIILFLFGDQWVPSIMIFQILVLKSFTYPISLLIVNTFLAGGKSKDNFWYGLVRKVVMLLPLLVALLYGFTPFLYAVTVTAYLNWILNNVFVSYSFKISLVRQCKVIVPYFMIFGILTAALYFTADEYMDFPFVGTIRAIIYAVFFLALNFFFKTRGFILFTTYLESTWKQLRIKLKM